MASGGNPYTTGLFNWPPFWIQCCFLISKVAIFLHAPFFRVLEVFLVLCETAVIVQVIKFIEEIAPKANAQLIALFGIALNPVAVLLVCQHCNFDVIMALWVLLSLRALLRYQKSQNQVDWLEACFWMGLGIFTKTVPLFLAPMLAAGFRNSCRWLGAALLLGPVTIGMGVIFSLDPHDVVKNVLSYRAEGYNFGIRGLLTMANALNDRFYNAIFYLALITLLIMTAIWFWKGKFAGRQIPLYGALLLTSVPVLGPGFGPQYNYWFLPVWVVVYGAYRGAIRWSLIAVLILSGVTYIVEYGLLTGLGFSWLYWKTGTHVPYELNMALQTTQDPGVIQLFRWHTFLETNKGQCLWQLPDFIAMMTTLILGIRCLLREQPKLETAPAATSDALRPKGRAVSGKPRK